MLETLTIDPTIESAKPEPVEEDADIGFPRGLLRTIEELIHDYLAADVTGGSASSSSFGAMVGRLELYGFESDPCPKCSKSEYPGFGPTGEDCDNCGGTAFVVDKGSDFQPRDFVSVRCKVCKGPGIIYNKTGSWLHLIHGENFACKRCEGDGCTTPGPDSEPHRKVRSIISHITHTQREASYSMDAGELERDGVISRVLAHMEEDDKKSGTSDHLAVRLYLGTIGSHWQARGSVRENRDAFNRLFALWPLTVAGQQLLTDAREDEKNKHLVGTDDHHVLADLVRESWGVKNDNRAPHIAQAKAAATELWGRALMALWRSDVVTGGRFEAYAKQVKTAEEEAAKNATRRQTQPGS